jgi:hypothetical protein
VTVLSAGCSLWCPIAAIVQHRPPGARPGDDRDPDPAPRKADELEPSMLRRVRCSLCHGEGGVCRASGRAIEIRPKQRRDQR